jgi:hypothetical protein
MPTHSGGEELGPTVSRELTGKELALAAELFCLGVHIVHELVDQGNRDLFDLALGVGHLANKEVAAGVYTAFGIGV